MPSRTPSLCPVCGDAVPAGATACPTCGACEKSGWKPDAPDLPGDDDFDYDRFVEEEFGGGAKKPVTGWFWWAVAVVVLAAFGFLLFH